MQAVSNDNFGPLIAYLVPGATALLGLSQFSPELESLFRATPPNAPTIGGFLYLTAASLAMGMTLSAVRWLLLDHIHNLTGIPMPRLDFSRLGSKVDALGLLIEIHYRHYLFYANMQVGTGVAYACYRAKVGFAPGLGLVDFAFAFLQLVFFFTSRDTLRKYYTRCEQILAHGA